MARGGEIIGQSLKKTSPHPFFFSLSSFSFFATTTLAISHLTIDFSIDNSIMSRQHNHQPATHVSGITTANSFFSTTIFSSSNLSNLVDITESPLCHHEPPAGPFSH